MCFRLIWGLSRVEVHCRSPHPGTVPLRILLGIAPERAPVLGHVRPVLQKPVVFERSLIKLVRQKPEISKVFLVILPISRVF